MDELISRTEVMKHMHFRMTEDGKTEGYVRTADILSIPAVEVDSKNVDLISRQDAIDAIERSGLTDDPCDTAIRLIEALPSAERCTWCGEASLLSQLRKLQRMKRKN